MRLPIDERPMTTYAAMRFAAERLSQPPTYNRQGLENVKFVFRKTVVA